jgi:excisionase family DNA binding protein
MSMPPARPVRPGRAFDVAGAVTVAEVAALLGISPLAVYRLIHTNELPATPVGGSIRVHPSDLAAYLHARGHRVTANPAPTRATHNRSNARAAERPALRLVSNRA